MNSPQENTDADTGILHVPSALSIVASIGNHEQIGIPDLSDVITEVDMDADPDEVIPLGFLKQGTKRHVISPIDETCKVSFRYAECTGVVAVGIDRETSRNVSFLSHQNPNYFQWYDDDMFEESLCIRLEELRERCVPDTIDLMVFGGRYVNAKGCSQEHKVCQLLREEYLSAISMLSGHVSRILGFVPAVVGPKFDECFEFVAFNTGVRRLYVARQYPDPRFVPAYCADEIETVRAGWTPGEWRLPEIKKRT